MATAPFITTARDITKEVDRLVAATKDLDFGAFIPHDQITELTGIDRDEPYLRGKLIKKWRRELLKHGRVLGLPQVRGTGYRILTRKEQLQDEPTRLQKLAERRINQAAQCLGAIDENTLDDDGKAFRVARLGQLAEMKKTSNEQRAAVTSWLSNPKLLPKVQPKSIK